MNYNSTSTNVSISRIKIKPAGRRGEVANIETGVLNPDSLTLNLVYYLFAVWP